MNRKAFLLLGFIMFLTMTGYGIVFPILPFLANDLHLSALQMSSLIIIWAVAQLITAPLWGRMADKIGRKPVLLFGVFGFGVAFLVLLFAQNYWQLLLLRMIGAALSSGTQPAAYSMVADQTEKKTRSQAIAKMGAVNGLGFLCGPFLGALISPLGVMAPFIVAGCLAFITLPFIVLYIKDSKAENTEEVRPDSKRETLSFWKSLAMVTKTGYWDLYTIIFGISLAASSFFGLIGYFMIARFDASPTLVSLAFSTQAGTSVVVQFLLLQKVYKYWDDETVTKIGLMITAAGYCFISFSPAIWALFFGCLLTGLGHSLVRPTTTALLSKRNEMGQGITMGLQHSMDSLGRIIGPIWGGWIFSFAVSAPFITSAIITLLLLGITYMTSNHKKIEMKNRHNKMTSHH
ncbi:MFS transporter [Robertmurraya andreesenii]|uniref:MFS family permease n=1 Tax=Anoxybacillus andreesenii TaxID=1325932 RepID=A0ABT9V153_9BACL|nr:MFS transporter [Robertmurraya andreesenii]MDQ0154636.1 MFS family permease [Robertmurraya andreesenii]